jgi:NADPH:quinone reductase-like Zn-dependent oxidoreductase
MTENAEALKSGVAPAGRHFCGAQACTIARAQGAVVVGLVSRVEQVAHVRDLGVDEVIVGSKDQPPALPGQGFDGVLDTVGGRLFGPLD